MSVTPQSGDELPFGDGQIVDVAIHSGANGQLPSNMTSWLTLRFKSDGSPWTPADPADANFACSAGTTYQMINDTAGALSLKARLASLSSISLAIGEIAIAVAAVDPATNTVEFRKVSSNTASAVTFAAVRAALAAATASVGFNTQQIKLIADGTAAQDGTTLSQTHYLPYSAPAPTDNLPTPVGMVFQAGGTATVPTAYTPIWYGYPRTAGTAPFTWSMGTAISFSTFDPTMLFGYNADLSVPAEPSAFFGVEGNYEYGAGQYQCEMYWQFGKGGTSLSVGGRPIFSVFDRVTADIKTTMEFGKTGASTGAEFFTVASRFDGNAITVTNAHIYLRRPEVGTFLFDSGTSATYLAIGGTGAGGVNIYDQPTYGAQRRFTTGNAKPDLVFSISTIVDPAVRTAFTALVAAFSSAGYDMVLNHTT